MISKVDFECQQLPIIPVHLHVTEWNASKLTLELFVHDLL